MVVKRAKPTPEEQRAARIAELDAIEGMRQADMARRQKMKAESDAFMLRVQQGREARQALIESGNYVAPVIPTLNDIMTEKREAERLEEERLEQERLASLSERDNIIAALPFATQQEITAYKKVRGVDYPLEALRMR